MNYWQKIGLFSTLSDSLWFNFSIMSIINKNILCNHVM